jgi:phage baseplate assembly protein W
MRQVIFKILNTERYDYVIYSWNYGIELSDLFGKPVMYACPEIERRVKEALTQDDRIKSVDSFEFDTTKRGAVAVKFTAHTIFGDIREGTVVTV